jgi:very-short-patch-repair endonuclease
MPEPPSPRLRRGGVGGGGSMTERKQRLVDKRVPRARSLRRAMTDAEKRLWQRLRQPPFKDQHFRRQATIGPYFADFASHQLRIVVEVDGGQHGGTYDQVRTRYLEAKGYRVVRFWNNDVLENTEGVLTAIAAIVAGPPPLTPPRRKRGEGNAGSLE